MGEYGEIPSNWVPVLEEPVFTPQKLRVVCIGAGYSGLMLTYKYKHEHHMDEYIDLGIYEKNPDIGGTWLENRYPGVACDVLCFYGALKIMFNCSHHLDRSLRLSTLFHSN